MEYRINRKTGDKISVLGMGTSAIAMAEEKKLPKHWKRLLRRESITMIWLHLMGPVFRSLER